MKYESLDYVYFFIILLMACPALKTPSDYGNLIKWYGAFVLLSCFYSWMYNGQALYKVIGHSYSFFSVFFFFALVRMDFSSDDILALLKRLALCFCICYIVQWIIYPVVLFSGATENDLTVSEEFYRARMPGSVCCYFLLIYAVNSYLLNREKINFIYAILAFIPIIVQGFRSLTLLAVSAVFLTIPAVLRNVKKSILYAVFVLCLFFIAISTPVVQLKIDEMVKRQENNQTFMNEDYIRYLSFDYYWNEQFTKPYEKIIGGGVPTDRSTQYYKTIRIAREDYGFFWRDLGIIGLGMVIGFPAVFLLVFMYVRCMWKCKEPELQYIRFTLFIVLFGSIFTTAELYRDGNILLLSLFLYIEYKFHQELEYLDNENEIEI